MNSDAAGGAGPGPLTFVATRCASCGPHPLLKPVSLPAADRVPVGWICPPGLGQQTADSVLVSWGCGRGEHWGLTLEALREQVARHVSEYQPHKNYLHNAFALTWAAVTGSAWPGCEGICDDVPLREMSPPGYPIDFWDWHEAPRHAGSGS